MTPTEELHVTWREGIAKDSTDHFPYDLFAATQTLRKQKHRVTWKTGQDWAWFDISVDDRSALLDYRPYGRLNNAHQMESGQLRITFTDSERTKVRSYEWKGLKEKRFQAAKFDHMVALPAKVGTYKPRRRSGTKREHRVKERHGQLAFKRHLMFAYGGRCCVTGCDV